MSHRELKEDLKSRFREIVAQQSRLLKVPNALDAVRQQCISHVMVATESFLCSWEDQCPSIELPCGLVRDAFSVVLSAVGPGDDPMRESILSLLVKVQSSDARQILLDVLPSTMPLGNDGLEDTTNQVLEALEIVLRKDWTAVIPVMGCLSIMPFDNNGRRQVLELALTNLSVVSESELPVLIRTLLRHVTTGIDARLALDALRSEMMVWEKSIADGATNNSDNGGLAMVIHIVLSSFQDFRNGEMIKTAYLAILHEIAQAIHDRMNDGGEDLELDDDRAAPFLVLDAAALILLRDDAIHSARAERVLDNLLRIDCFSFATFSWLVDFTFDRKRRSLPLLHDIMVSPMHSLCFFVLLLPVRTILTSDQSPVLQHIQDMVELVYHAMDLQRRRELVLGLIHLIDKSSYDIQQGKRRRGRPRNSTSVQVQHKVEGIDTTISMVHSILRKLAQRDRATLSRFKEILMCRLTATSSERVTKRTQKSIQQICTTLTCLVEPVHAEPGGGRGIDTSEMLIFLQKLLFASSQCFQSQIVQERGGDVGRTVSGMLLAMELVQSPSLSNSDRDCIKQWVLRILLPSTRRMVDPEIGWPGLCFLDALSTGKEQDKSELFSNLKMILANTGLIQMLAHYLQRKKANNHTFLGYSRIPLHFHVETGTLNQRKKREMVFCLSICMRHINTTDPQRWECAVQWVFDLVNKYLRIGRELAVINANCSTGSKRSKWLPYSWLEAAIEFPSLDIGVTTQGNVKPTTLHTLNCIRSKFSSQELSFDDDICESIDGDIGDVLVEGKSHSELRDLCYQLSRTALATLLSLGVAAAVLANTFEHYKTETAMAIPNESSGSNQICKEHQSLLRLLQYQLCKIYDLREKSRIVGNILCVCSSSMRRCKWSAKLVVKRANCSRSEGESSGMNSTGNTDDRLHGKEQVRKVSADCENVSKQTRVIVASLFASNDFISESILWESLVDSEHDALIDRILAIEDTSTHSKSEQNEFNVVTSIRESVMDHICINETLETPEKDPIKSSDPLVFPTINREITSATPTCFDRCYQQSMKMLTIIPQLRKQRSPKEEHATKMVTSLLLIVLRVLESTVSAHVGINGCKSQKADRATYSACLKICTSIPPASGDRQNIKEGPPEIVAFQNILGYLCVCEGAHAAYLLMEILCFFAQRRKFELLDLAISASWRDLHTVYSKSVSTKPSTSWISLAFMTALRRFQQSSPQRNRSIERLLLATVVKAAFNQTREYTRNSLLRHSILRHWGLIALSVETAGLRHFNHISKLIAELKSYLNSINDVQRDDFKEDIVTNNRDACFSSIPSLTGASFAVYYELLLYFVVAMFAICPPSVPVSIESSHFVGPYQHFHQLIELFSQLVDLFRDNIKLFPRRLFPVFVGCCKHMIKLASYQVRCCVDWRNSRPLLSTKEKASGVDDVGSIQYLQALLEAFSTHLSVLVMSFCQFIGSQSGSKKRYDSDDSAYSDSETGASWAFTSHRKKLKVLESHAETFLLFLREVSTSHNIVLSLQPSLKKGIVLSADERADKLNQSDLGFHQCGSPNSRLRKRFRLAPELKTRPTRITGMKCDDGSSDESLGSYDGGDRRNPSSASFAVAGDWGNDSDSADESNSSLSLEAMDRV